MTDAAVQQLMDTNSQSLVNQSERQALIQKLTAKWSLELSTKVEKLAYEKSRGNKPLYWRFVQQYCQQVQIASQNRINRQQQQQQQQQTLQSLNNINNNNNNGQFLNQQLNSQHPSVSMLGQPQLNHILNQPPNFPSQPQSLQPRMLNPQAGIINTQTNTLNQVVRLREPPKFNQTPMNTMSYTGSSHASASSSSSIPTIDLSQNNTNLNDYLPQPSLLTNRYSNQPQGNARLRPTVNLNGNFPQASLANNSNAILHQYVVGNPPTNSIVPSVSATSMVTPITANTSSSGDRLLQKILSSNNDGTSNTMPLHNRSSSLQQPPPPPTVMTQAIRSATATNSNNNNTNNSVNSLRSSLLSQQTSPSSSSVIIMPTSTQTSNVQIQSSPNVTIQQSPLTNNNNSGSFSMNTQSMPQQPSSLPMNSSTPLLNTYSSPVNRSLPSAGSGSISSPDEETINLIKFLKENLGRLQILCQKFTNEGNIDKVRNAQAIHQQMVQFIQNPTYESLSNAKHIRDMLEKASNRPQQSNALTINVPSSNPPGQQINSINQFEKAFTEYLSRDQRKRLILSKLFIEPLNDVAYGAPHKKMRLDGDMNHSNSIVQHIRPLNQSSLLSHLNAELSLLPAKIFSIENVSTSPMTKSFGWDDEYLSKKGVILRCKLSESCNPLIPSLRLRISTRYPDEQPEILSLTQTMPPRLEFTDGHPYLEQVSTLFVSYLFKLPPQHTITDILNIWRQSVQAAL